MWTSYSRRTFLKALGLGGLIVGGGNFSSQMLQPQALAAAAKRRGGTLTVAMPGDFVSLDPYQNVIGNMLIYENLYDSLITYDHPADHWRGWRNDGP